MPRDGLALPWIVGPGTKYFFGTLTVAAWSANFHAKDADMIKTKRVLIGLFAVLTSLPLPLRSQEKLPSPYFIAYSHYLEEPDTLDIEVDAVRGEAHGIDTFVATATQFEYGVRKWWTSELYLDTQTTQHQGSSFTGFRIENRFRIWEEPRKVNPVLYVEYENVTGADRILKEIVGFDSKADLAVPISISNREHNHELETRLILSSDIGQWNLAGNFIGEKDLGPFPWEFGYALGVSRPLAAAAGNRCAFCAEKFSAGVELYGGAGTWNKFTLRGTSQYLAPDLLWQVPGEVNLKVSVGWGLTDESVRMLIRFGVSKDIDGFGRKLGSLFGRH